MSFCAAGVPLEAAGHRSDRVGKSSAEAAFQGLQRG